MTAVEEERRFYECIERRNKKWPIPKTIRSRTVVIDDKTYNKCPYRGCNYMLEDSNYAFYPKIDKHVREVHQFVWMNKGGSGGWYHLSKFHRISEAERDTAIKAELAKMEERKQK